MTNTRTLKITQLALIVALSLVFGKVFQFTMVVGFFTLLDVGIYLAAFRFGKKEAAVVGALSGFLIDLISGYPQYMIPSLIAHGSQGYLAGLSGKKRPLGLILATVAMVGVYYLVDSFFEGNFVTPLGSLPGNAFQTIVGLVLGYIIHKGLERLGK